jgi:hypothetical protein
MRRRHVNKALLLPRRIGQEPFDQDGVNHIATPAWQNEAAPMGNYCVAASSKRFAK